METKKKILVFENDPQYFESTELYKYLTNKKLEWDFACTLNWDLGDLLKCGLQLINEYDTIATETFFGYTKRDLLSKDRDFEGGQLREMIMLLAAVLPIRSNPLEVLFNQKIVGGKKITKTWLKEYLTTEEKFIRFSTSTRFVLDHKNLNLKVLNLYEK